MNTAPAVFFSYTRADDERENRRLSQMRKALEKELSALSGDEWTVFQDVEHIEIGEQWKKRLAEGVGGSTFFLPILTPTYLKRPICREELSQFLEKESELGRDDLVFPLLYLDTPSLTDKGLQKSDPLAAALAARNWDDWRELRTFRLDTAKVRRRLTALSQAILSANKRASAVQAPLSMTSARTSEATPPLSARRKQKIRSIVTIAWSVVPLTALLSQWVREIQLQGVSAPESLNYPVAKFGPWTMDLIEELYSLVRAQQHSTTAIEWTPALDLYRKELRSLEAAGFLKGRHAITADFGKGLRLTNGGFIIDLALLCDDPLKAVKLNEIVEGAKKSLNGAQLSLSSGLPLIVVNAFFQKYEQMGQGTASRTIGESQYIPHDVI
jgi:hypothetical protein